jgi:hypothetical protein
MLHAASNQEDYSMFRTRLLVAAAALVVLLVTPIAWYLISPLFITRTVNEDFPAAQAAMQDSMSANQSGDAMMASTSDAIVKPMPTTMTDTSNIIAATAAPTTEPAPTAEPITEPAPTVEPTTEPAPTVEPTPETMAAKPTAKAAPDAMAAKPAEPKRLRTGKFHPVEHEGTGTATIYELPNGKRVLRLENFEVLNGPDLFVWLSSAPDANNAKTILNSQYVSLGRLKGNKGNQNYELPADLDLSRVNSVTIWCRQFSVNFATAPLR